MIRRIGESFSCFFIMLFVLFIISVLSVTVI